MEVLEETSLSDVVCPSCGSHFSLVSHEPQTFPADQLETVGQFKLRLAAPDPEERAYWMGALLREANTRDVWLFVSSGEIRELWPLVVRHLGRSRAMWAWLVGLPLPEPPVTGAPRA